ncbi:Cyclin-like protein, partial [Globisporangium splendens]
MAIESLDKWVFPAFRAFVLARPSGSAASQTPTQSDGNVSSAAAAPTASQIPWDVEQQLRRTTCEFVEDLAAIVEIPDAPTVAAQLYVQRFYMLHSFQHHDRFLLATAAVFLAAKTEEFPIKVRLLTECSLYLLLCKHPDRDELRKKSSSKSRPALDARNIGGSANGGPRSQPPSTTSASRRKNSAGKVVEMSASLGNDPEAANARHLDCLHALLEVIDVGEVETTASKVLLLERILLQTISFDIGIPQPFAYVARAMEKVFALEAIHPSIPYDDIRELAFLLLSDAIKSGLCLAFNPVELAAGAVYISCLYRCNVSPNVATDANDPWWNVLGLSSQQLECVARGLLWMYEDANGRQRHGLSPQFRDLWTHYRPEQNLPDLEYIKKLDADLQQGPQ